MVGNLSIRWGKRCYTHTASISRIPARQHRLQSESMGGVGGWKLEVIHHTDQPLLAIERWEGRFK